MEEIKIKGDVNGELYLEFNNRTFAKITDKIIANDAIIDYDSNYVTNLQHENEKLDDEICDLTDKIDRLEDDLEDANDDLSSIKWKIREFKEIKNPKKSDYQDLIDEIFEKVL